ncbi:MULTISPECIES: amidohydrolase family protein [unclassified Haladaptatus]|uniref:amidohydrolase family protein n=1 Tax=unclassified Haladaptatus TaxID=2622732 RepID=UPI002FCE6757
MLIDCHVHMNPFWLAKQGAIDKFRNLQRRFDEAWEMAENPELFLEYLDTQGFDGAVAINYVSKDIVGYPPEVNEFAAEFRDAAPDRLRSVAGIDLDGTVDDVHARMDRIIDDLDLDGVKLHPPHQDVRPNAYRDPPVGNNNERLEVLYQRCADADIPVVIHTGTSFFPGARNIHTDPMYVDDVCMDFDVDVVMCHGGRPLYYDEAFYLYRRHDNIYFDISSIPPTNLLDAFPKLESIAHKTMFGSDWPAPMIPDIKDNADDVRDLGLSQEATDAIMGGNAEEVFGF